MVVTKVDDREGCLWHLVDRGHGCCEASQKKKCRDRTAPTRKNYLAPYISSAEVKKPSSSLKDPEKVHTHKHIDAVILSGITSLGSSSNKILKL